MTPFCLSGKVRETDDVVPDDVAPGRPRYVCLACENDPLRDPAARKWAESPLRPPAK